MSNPFVNNMLTMEDDQMVGQFFEEPRMPDDPYLLFETLDQDSTKRLPLEFTIIPGRQLKLLSGHQNDYVLDLMLHCMRYRVPVFHKDLELTLIAVGYHSPPLPRNEAQILILVAMYQNPRIGACNG